MNAINRLRRPATILISLVLAQPAAAMVLVLGMDNPQLRIQGKAE